MPRTGIFFVTTDQWDKYSIFFNRSSKIRSIFTDDPAAEPVPCVPSPIRSGGIGSDLRKPAQTPEAVSTHFLIKRHKESFYDTNYRFFHYLYRKIGCTRHKKRTNLFYSVLVFTTLPKLSSDGVRTGIADGQKPGPSSRRTNRFAGKL